MTRDNQENDSYILRHDQNGVCTLTLNRPKAYNALSIGCMEALTAELDSLKNDSSVKVVILAGSGKGFCAGHDLKEMRATPTREFYEKTFKTCSKLMLTIIRLPKPVIARVHGIATAAGCQLVATCDLGIADENTRFATPGVNIGLFCSTPMVALSRAVVKKHALEMLLTGDMIPAERAYQFGLINKVVPPDQLESAARELAEKIASKSPVSLKIGKEAFYKQLELGLESAYDYCGRVMTENMLTTDAAEGISALMEKRPPVWCGE
jgi:enoyl-CoA hydratase/carnithine racemase